MPSFACKNANCTELLTAAGYCDRHQPDQQAHVAARDRQYNRFARNKQHQQFYHSARWLNCRDEYIRQHPVCDRCEAKVAQHVHHRIPLGTCTTDQEIDPANLQALCIPCHNAVEAQVEQPDPVTAIGTIEPVEDATYFFDAEAADAPIRFIEKFCRHFEGKWAGMPFTLLEWQKGVIRTLFGWKHRSTNLRRFRELYLISAKGAG